MDRTCLCVFLYILTSKITCDAGASQNRIAGIYRNQVHKNVGGNQVSVQKDIPEKPAESSAQGFLGPDVKLEQYDNDMYLYRNGGPVQFVDELPTDFGSSNCWDNSAKQKIKWQHAVGSPNPKNFQQYLGTSKLPDEDYLVAYSSGKRAPTDDAVFESCSINCVSGDLQFSVRYWMSAGVNLEVCIREVFFDDEAPNNCQKLPQQKTPGPATLTFKMKELSAIVIKADNFVDEKGGIAVIDDIKVTYTPCDEAKQSTTAPPAVVQTAAPPAPVIATPAPNTLTDGSSESQSSCENVVCTFQHSFCSYKDFTDLGKGTKNFSPQQGRFHNLLTGIQALPNRKKYAAAYLLKNDVAGLESGPLSLSGDRILQFQHFEATQGIHMKVCLDNELKCPIISGDVVTRIDRQWKQSFVRIPKETKKILFVCENKSVNEGAVAITDVQLLIPDGNSGRGTRNACPNILQDSVVVDSPQSNNGNLNQNNKPSDNQVVLPVRHPRTGSRT